MNQRLSAIALTCLLLTIFSTVSHAQQSIDWGLKAGPNLMKVGGRSFDDKYRVSFTGGAYAELNYKPKWSLQPELLFNQTLVMTGDGFNQIYNGVGTQLVALDYIAVPVLIAFKPIPELSILVGPQYGFLFSQTSGLLPQQGNKKAFSQSDLSLIIGGQFNLGRVKAGLRYMEGLNNINGINSSDGWRQYGLQLYLGYQIGEKKRKK